MFSLRGGGAPCGKTKHQVWVLCKGSPEAMKPLLDEGGLPDWYEEEYERLARSGRRVVALAHRSLGSSQANGGCRTLGTVFLDVLRCGDPAHF